MSHINYYEVNRKLIKNTGIIAFGQLSTKLINFLLLPVYTALLTTEEYGLIDLLSTYAALLTVAIGLQLNQGIFRFLVTERENKAKIKEIISTTILALLMILVIYSLIFCILQSFIILDFKWYLLIQVVASINLQIMSGISRGLGYNTRYAIGNFLSAAVTLVLNMIGIVYLQLGVKAILIAYIMGPFSGAVYLFVFCKIYKYIRFSDYSKRMLRKIIEYSFPLIPNEISWFLIHSSDRIIVSYVLTIAANGMIAVASKFSVIYTTLFSIFNVSWTEQVMLHYKDEGGKKYIVDMFEKVVFFFGTLAIGIISCMPFVFEMLVNEQFSESYGLVPLYMIAVFFNAMIGVISAIYLIENETGMVAITTMAAAAVNMITNLIFIKFIGVYAAPISSICGYGTITFWRLYDVNRRHCKIHLSVKKSGLMIGALLFSLFSFYSRTVSINIITLILMIPIFISLNKEIFLTIKNFGAKVSNRK